MQEITLIQENKSMSTSFARFIQTAQQSHIIKKGREVRFYGVDGEHNMNTRGSALNNVKFLIV